jgi:tetratricopeptide (TPR) repeat protein
MRRLFALFFWIAALTVPAFCQTYLIAPFANRTKIASLDWLGESLAETVRETLAEDGYSTIGREDREEAARRLALRPVSQVSLASLAKLCEGAGADRLVYGRIEFLPDASAPAPGKGTLRVIARVLDVKDAVQIAEFFESGPVLELGGLETDLAWKIQRWARPERHVDLEQFRAQHPPVKNTARENYVRGLLATSADQRHRLLTQAARLDPSFTQPAFVLGREHFLKGNFREASGWLERVPPRNLNYIEAQFVLALCRYQLGEFDAARQLLEQISARVPVPEVWNNLGAAQARLNDPRSLENFKKALEADSTDSDYQFNMGYSLWKRGEFESAANYFRAVLDHSGGDQDSIQLLGRCLKKSGPRAGDWRTEGLERLKESYEEPGPR